MLGIIYSLTRISLNAIAIAMAILLPQPMPYRSCLWPIPCLSPHLVNDLEDLGDRLDHSLFHVLAPKLLLNLVGVPSPPLQLQDLAQLCLGGLPRRRRV